MYLIKETKRNDKLNAVAHSTHASFTTNGNLIAFSVESNSSKQAMRVELVDK